MCIWGTGGELVSEVLILGKVGLEEEEEEGGGLLQEQLLHLIS